MGWARHALRGAGLLLLSLPAAAATLSDADALFRRGRHAEAADLLERMAVERPGEAELWRRLGAARYRGGDAEGAARAYDLADDLAGGGSADDAFNSGNAHWLAGRLERALERYEEALERQPGHRGAKANRSLVQQELSQREQAAPPPTPEEGSEGAAGEEGEAGAQPGSGESGEGSGGAAPGEGEGEPEQGEGEGEPSAGEPGAEGGPGEPMAGGPPGEPPPSGDGPSGSIGDEQRHPDVVSETVRPGEVRDPGAPAAPISEGLEGSGDPAGPLSQEQAERLLEGVEEGRPRVVLPGTESDKPW